MSRTNIHLRAIVRDYSYWRLSRFTVQDGQTVADPNSELILIQQFDRQQWHDSGTLVFGTDGFLYVGIGDEGGAGDQYNDSQKINDRLFSGILRIDVNQDPTKSHAIRRQPLPQAAMPAGWPASYTANYSIPNDNPWVNPDGSVLEEFYALGFRNPYKFCMDPETGKIWVGDVGQDTMEEINLLVKGGNYGWAFREGTGAGPKAQPATIIGALQEPKFSYNRSLGGCVVCGYFYHGSQHPSLTGKLLIVDNTSGRIWALTKGADDSVTAEYLCSMPSGSVYSGTVACVQEQNGEIYFLKLGNSYSGEFYKLIRTGATVAEPPALLSQTGAFTNMASLTPRAGLIPYDVNAALWSDAALKKRWISVPNDGTHNTAGEKIKFAPDGEWTFPPGTVLVKHFELATNENNPSAIRKLETRFLVISSTGEPYGVTYRWRPDGTDADLLTVAASDNITVSLAGGGTRNQTWSYPSRSDCMICHNSNAKYVLGVKTWQLNGNMLYPKTGRTANQLATLGHLGIFDDAYHEEHIPYFLKAKNIADVSAPLETRIRSYIDANCAQCHRPNGVRANFDARFTTPIENQHIIRGKIEDEFTGQPESVIQPGDAAHSVMYLRTTPGWDEADASDRQEHGRPPRGAANPELGELARQRAVGDALAEQRGGGGRFPHRCRVFEFGHRSHDLGLQGPVWIDREPVGFGSGLCAARLANSGFHAGCDCRSSRRHGLHRGLGNYASNRLVLERVDPGLVTWLKMDETTGLVAMDSSGNNNPGVVTNISNDDWTTGKFNGALRFDQTNSRLALNNVITDDFTVSFWVKTSQDFPETQAVFQGAPFFFADAPGVANDLAICGTRSGTLNRISVMTASTATGSEVLSLRHEEHQHRRLGAHRDPADEVDRHGANLCRWRARYRG